MTGIQITGTTQPMQDALRVIGALKQNARGVLGALGLEIIESTKERMRAGLDPAGKRWASYAPLHPEYAKTKRGPSILIGRGNVSSGLIGSLTSQIHGHRLVWGSNKIYARIHQLGGTIRPKSAKALTFKMGGKLYKMKKVTIPARPYLGFTDADKEVLMDELHDYLSRAMRGGQ